MEQLVVTDDIMSIISRDASKVNANDIAKSAHNSGMVTMLQKGLLKALRGETTIEEVNRVL